MLIHNERNNTRRCKDGCVEDIPLAVDCKAFFVRFWFGRPAVFDVCSEGIRLIPVVTRL